MRRSSFAALALAATGCGAPDITPEKLPASIDVARVAAVHSPAPAADPPPSCRSASTCAGQSCCARARVPSSGKIAAFDLDVFEVTVGRYRAWIEAGQSVPNAGEILHGDVRWPAHASVRKDPTGWARYDTWTGGDDTRPKNFVTWFEAAAFCHFDGGRLPAEAEWKLAATGGDEARPHPWGAEPPSAKRAVYNCNGDGKPGCTLADILPVGSRPDGAARWGHMDMAGSMFEWTLEVGDAGRSASARGGGFCFIGGVDKRAGTSLETAQTRREDPGTSSHMVGFRCAYDVTAPASR